MHLKHSIVSKSHEKRNGKSKKRQIKLNAMSWSPQNAHLLHWNLEWEEHSWNVSFRKWCQIGHNGWAGALSGHKILSSSLHSVINGASTNNSIINIFLLRFLFHHSPNSKLSMKLWSKERQAHKMELIAISDIAKMQFKFNFFFSYFYVGANQKISTKLDTMWLQLWTPS